MDNELKKKIKFFVIFVAILAGGYFFVVSPFLTFQRNEKMVEDAAKRYYELNAEKLPTGQRISTLSVKTLYHKNFLEKDIYVPYSSKTCSLDNSWVKVRKENEKYVYYTYLDCGFFSSKVDSKGPNIKLKGNSNIQIGVGEEYKELGVESVVDSVDGRLKTDDVTIKGKVDTSKVGTYEISYIAFDSMQNKTTAVRTVKVVQKVYSTIKKDLGEETNYTDNTNVKYVRLSNMMFQVYGLDSNKNVILVASRDIANVSYSKLDSWLKYYYNHLNKKTQDMIVPSKYCDMKITEENLGTVECNSYSKPKNITIPSIVDVNRTLKNSKYSFMKPVTMSWVSNLKSDKEGYVTRDYFYGDDAGKNFISFDINHNYGVRPMFTIKGSSLIIDGDGTLEDPFVFGDREPVKKGSYLNNRSTGEYISDGNILWRIVDVMKDKTIKVISNETIIGDGEDLKCQPDLLKEVATYNPKDKNSVGYYINNRVSEYVDTSHFVNHEIEVPIYKNEIIYGEEKEIKKYKAVLSAPNMFEMFSAIQSEAAGSYWFVNTSQTKFVIGDISEIGTPDNYPVNYFPSNSVRVVAYFDKNTIIDAGYGTYVDPFTVK